MGLIITRAHRPLNPGQRLRKRVIVSASTVSLRDDRRLAVRAIDVAGPVVHHCLGRATCPVVAVPLEAPAKIHKIAPERRDR